MLPTTYITEFTSSYHCYQVFLIPYPANKQLPYMLPISPCLLSTPYSKGFACFRPLLFQTVKK